MPRAQVVIALSADRLRLGFLIPLTRLETQSSFLGLSNRVSVCIQQARAPRRSRVMEANALASIHAVYAPAVVCAASPDSAGHAPKVFANEPRVNGPPD